MISLDAGRNKQLKDVLALATGGDEQSIKLVIEAIGECDHAIKAFIAFMDGITIGGNPTLLQTQYNQYLVTQLFKHVSEYVVAD